ADVLALRPDYAVLSGLRVGVVAAWDREKDGTDAQYEVRAFTAGGYEDPVTGSLNAGIAQWLIGADIAPPTYVASQGTALGRAGRVHVERCGSEIWIGGTVTTCIAGPVTLCGSFPASSCAQALPEARVVISSGRLPARVARRGPAHR